MQNGLRRVSKSFDRVEVQRGSGRGVGGIQTAGAVLEVGDRRGRSSNILLAVGAPRERAYLTQVLARDPNCSRSFAEGQVILNSVRLSK